VDLSELFLWLELSPIGELMQTSDWAFPAAEVVHVIAVVTVYGFIAIVDLRLLGLAGASRRYTKLAAETLHFVWIAFALAVITGFLMFTTQPSQYAGNSWFVAKMIFILLAGVNMLVMELILARRAEHWHNTGIPTAAKVAGGLSLSFWTIVVICGRWIGFTMLGPAFLS
jgi:hypothetical protein